MLGAEEEEDSLAPGCPPSQGCLGAEHPLPPPLHATAQQIVMVGVIIHLVPFFPSDRAVGSDISVTRGKTPSLVGQKKQMKMVMMNVKIHQFGEEGILILVDKKKKSQIYMN